MNHEALREKMDRFFDSVSVDELVCQLQQEGYTVLEASLADVIIGPPRPMSIRTNELDLPGMSFNDTGDYSYAMAA